MPKLKLKYTRLSALRSVLYYAANYFFYLSTAALICAYLPSAQSAPSKTALFNKQSSVRAVFLGDSLTEGYGVTREQAYPFLVEAQFKAAGFTQFQSINAGISGSTSASAASRLKWLLKQKPTFIFLNLGANDGLRGLLPKDTEKNLTEAIEAALAAQVTVVLAGMKVPPNYTKNYAKEFESVFPKLAKKYNLPYLPFFLEGVAGKKFLNQNDGIHPNEAGHVIVAEHVFQFLLKNLSVGP